MNKVFLDANIVLDFLDSSRKSHYSVKRLFNLLIERNCRCVISEDILTTIYYVMRDKRAALDFFELIVSEWDLVSFGKDVILRAIDICRKEGSADFEDVCQALAARQAGCQILISNDTGFYPLEGLTVLSSVRYVSG